MNILLIAISTFVLWFLFKRLTTSKANFKELVANGALIIDVRSPQEYDNGHIATAVNIPLHEVAAKAPMLAQKNQPIIACCASGMRSGQACSILKQKGITCYNGGGWQSLEKRLA